MSCLLVAVIMRTALAQVTCSLGNKESNLDRMEEVVSTTDADMIIFPEMFLTGYMCRDRFHDLTEHLEGESVSRIKEIAADNDRHIILGLPLRHPLVRGQLTNSALAVSPDGTVQRYDKLFLPNFGPFEEGLYFAYGDGPRIFNIGGLRLGPVICYDLFFPELAKWYAINGADAIICLSAGPSTSRYFFERLIPARAIENAAYCVYVNQVGTQLNQVFFGGSQAFTPRGERTATCPYYEDGVATFEISRADLEMARRFRPTIRDTVNSPRAFVTWNSMEDDPASRMDGPPRAFP